MFSKAAHEQLNSGRLLSHGLGGLWAAWHIGPQELSLGGLGRARDGKLSKLPLDPSTHSGDAFGTGQSPSPSCYAQKGAPHNPQACA